VVFEDLGLLFFTALILSLFLTPASISFAQRIGAMDTPVDRSVHVRIMPRMGGLGMAIAVVIALFLFVDLNQAVVGFLIGVLIIVATGVLDDLVQLRPVYKMFGQFLASVSFLWISGLSLSSIGNLFGLGSIDFLPWIAFLVTLFCMIGTINALNLSDGLDGLAAGLTMIAAVFMGIIALQAQNWIAMFILVALLGSTLGFLKFNTYPAKLFMGDTGSLMLGFFMGSLIVFLVDFDGVSEVNPITLAIILAVPVSDTLLVMTRRILQGKSPVSADKTHLHHRLLSLGLDHAMVVVIIYIIAFYFGFLALFMQHQAEWLQLIAGLASCAVIYISISACEHYKLSFKNYLFLQGKPEALSSSLTTVVGKSMKWFRLIILLGLLFPVFFVVSIPTEVSNLLLGVLLLILFAYPWREHKERLNIVYGLFYIAGLAILYVWNISTFDSFSLSWYMLGFVAVLSVWSMLKIRFKGHQEVFLTSGLEVLLIIISWFVPYTLLPALNVSEEIMIAAKTSCLEAIPLLIAMKIVTRRQPDRNYLMVVGLLAILLWMLLIF